MKCDTCKYNRTTTEDIIVDNRIADQYVSWGCAKEDEMSGEELDIAAETEGDICSFYEYNKDLDDPCYGCPGSPDYCDECNNKEQE